MMNVHERFLDLTRKSILFFHLSDTKYRIIGVFRATAFSMIANE